MKRSYALMGIAALVLATLAGCGGDDGADGAPGKDGTNGTDGKDGKDGKDGGTQVILTEKTPPEEFAALKIVPTVTSATVNPADAATDPGKPVVNFRLVTDQDKPIIGFGSNGTCFPRNSTIPYTDKCYPNLAFSIAKMVPGDAANPSKWVNYIVTTAPTSAAAAAPSRPSTDNTGKLVDHGDGTYTYTFYRNIVTMKDQVAAMSVSPPKNKADLGDLTYSADLVHRLTIQISGSAPGTGTNTPTGEQATPSVPLSNPVDVIYDFTPATGATAASGRQMVDNANCNTCHQTLGGLPDLSEEAAPAGFHGGSRNTISYCVVCHTDQRKYDRSDSTFDATNTFTTTTYKQYGYAVGNARSFLHKVHLGEMLAMKGYDYGGVLFNHTRYPQDIRNCDKCHDTSNAATPDASNWKNKPSAAACGACHDGIDFATGKGVTLADANAGLTSTSWPGTPGWAHIGGPQADNSSCGTANCHSAEKIDLVHRPVTPANALNALVVPSGAIDGVTPNPAGSTNTNAGALASNLNRLPEGAIKVSYDLKSVARLSDGTLQMVFRLMQQKAGEATATAVPLQTFSSAVINPATGMKEIWADFMGSPSLYFVYAVPQDGIAKPAEFNATASVYLRTLWYCTNGGGVPGTFAGSGAQCPGTLSYDSATGYYTAVINKTGTSSSAVALNVPAPDAASPSSMLTGGIGYSYNNKSSLPLTQTNLSNYPAAPSTIPVAVSSADSTANPGKLSPGMPNAVGGLIVIAPNTQVVASGYTGRREIVAEAKCNACHQELGAFTEDSFHAGQRNDARTCAWCHTPNRSSSGWSADSTSFVHSIHAASKLNPTSASGKYYTWHAISADVGFWQIGYPGVVNNCEGCHNAGYYDFSASDSASAAESRLFRTAAAGTFKSIDSSAYAYSPWIAGLPGYTTATGAVLGSAPSFSSTTQTVTTSSSSANLVTSPTTTVCLACHTSADAKSHMAINGGSIYAARGTGTVPNAGVVESCLVCHGASSSFAIKDAHAR